MEMKFWVSWKLAVWVKDYNFLNMNSPERSSRYTNVHKTIILSYPKICHQSPAVSNAVNQQLAISEQYSLKLYEEFCPNSEWVPFHGYRTNEFSVSVGPFHDLLTGLNIILCRLLGKFAKSHKAPKSFVMSIWPHVSIQFPRIWVTFYTGDFY
jgi:hypothetical protein